MEYFQKQLFYAYGELPPEEEQERQNLYAGLECEILEKNKLYIANKIKSMRPTEVKLNNPPEDAISAVKFGPKTNQYLIASAWDGTVRFYDVVNNAMRQKFVEDMPVLDVAFMVNK